MITVLRVLKNDLKKIVLNHSFILSTIMTFILCFTAVVYVDGSGKEISVFEILINPEKYNYVQLNCTSILRDSLSPYLTIFLPVLTAIPFAFSFCSERNSGNIRMTISRNRKLTYYTAKFLSALISGGVLVLAAFIVYSIVICAIFSSENNVVPILFQQYGGVFLYGTVSVIPALTLSSFIKNKYIICCFPFILMHFYYTILSRISSKLIQDGNYKAMMSMDFLYPSNLKSIFVQGSEINFLYLIYALEVIIAFVFYVIVLNRRLDYGE